MGKSNWWGGLAAVVLASSQALAQNVGPVAGENFDKLSMTQLSSIFQSAGLGTTSTTLGGVPVLFVSVGPNRFVAQPRGCRVAATAEGCNEVQMFIVTQKQAPLAALNAWHATTSTTGMAVRNDDGSTVMLGKLFVSGGMNNVHVLVKTVLFIRDADSFTTMMNSAGPPDLSQSAGLASNDQAPSSVFASLLSEGEVSTAALQGMRTFGAEGLHEFSAGTPEVKAFIERYGPEDLMR